MARTKETGEAPSKSQFMRETLGKDKSLGFKDMQKAWTDAGHEGELKAPLYYQVKRLLGMKGKRGRKPGKASQAAVATAPAAYTSNSKWSAGSSGYLQLEHAIDELVMQAMKLGDESVINALRNARRHVAAKLIA